MKFLYVFLCLICLLNYTTFNQLGRVDEHSKISLIEVKLLNLRSYVFSNDDESHEGVGDRQDETEGNGSSDSSSNDPEEDEEDSLGSFGGVSLSSPGPRRKKLWNKGPKRDSSHSNPESDEDTGPFGGAPLSSPGPRRKKLWKKGPKRDSSHSNPESDEVTGLFGGLPPRPPSPLRGTPRKNKLKGRF